MASKRPTTIAEYIQAAPLEGQPHLRRLFAILKSVAPEAGEAIKWGTPFFVEPRFLFAFSAHKAHLSFAPTAPALEAFRKELEEHKTTPNFASCPPLGKSYATIGALRGIGLSSSRQLNNKTGITSQDQSSGLHHNLAVCRAR